MGADVFSDGLHEPADVGIVARDGAFEERGVDDGFADRARQLRRRRCAHRDADHVAHALAVAHDIFGEIAAHLRERGFEGDEIGAGDATRGNERDGVGGARVAIDADGVETRLDGALESGAQFRAGHVQIGQHVNQHRGHVGLDHARAFGDADDAAGADVGSTDFGIKVGGDDAFGRR